MLTLRVTERTSTGKGLGKLRAEGFVPAVVYGATHEATAIQVGSREFDKIFHEAGESTIVSLTGLGEAIPTLIHEVDLDPLTSSPRHIDFYAITKGQKVEIKIPVEFTGESPAVKGGANLVKVLHEIEIEADPMNLPKEFTVDISNLANVGDQVRVSDLNIPAGVELKTDPEEVIALIQEVVEEKEEAPPVDLEAIEVEQKGKALEDAEGEAPTPAPEEK